MNRILDTLFLRMYGFNLGRGFRNMPEQAYRDAVVQVSSALVVPFALVLGWASSYIPNAAEHIHSRDAPFLIVVAVLILPCVYWSGRRFRRYRHTPEAAAPFREPSERLKSIVVFVLFPLLMCAAFGGVEFLIRR
jgi:hypothetical protein